MVTAEPDVAPTWLNSKRPHRRPRLLSLTKPICATSDPKLYTPYFWMPN